MTKKNILLLIVLGITLIIIILHMGLFDILFGKNKSKQKTLDNNIKVYSHDNLKSEKFERYIIVIGDNFKSVEAKLKDYGLLPAKGNSYTYRFSKGKIADWFIIKVPSDFQDYYGFHNIVYWMLGTPPEDNNYADVAIGLSISEEVSYVIYNNYKLQGLLNLEDNLFGVFSNDEKFILSIPFDNFNKSDNKYIYSFNNLFLDNGIDLELIKQKKIVFQEFEVLFNEK